MKKYYSADCPSHLSLNRWLRQITDWDELAKSIKPNRDYQWGLKFKIDNFDAQELARDLDEAMELYGRHPWRTAAGNVDRYTGFSLVYNPNLHEDVDPHASTLGTVQRRPQEFYTIVKTENVRNGYYDTYAFTVRTPASQYKSIGRLLDRTRRTMIRGRLSTLDGAASGTALHGGIDGWHIDEPIFENLRINIPVVTTDNYLFEMKTDNEYKVEHLDVGYAYTWNTLIPHRVFNTTYDVTPRTHFVIGVSTWWDYLPEEDAWVQNEFYGVKHPFDMLADGDVFEGLTYVER